jgi:hypothetical protein
MRCTRTRMRAKRRDFQHNAAAWQSDPASS